MPTSSGQTGEGRSKTATAKAEASKTNRGAVERMAKLREKRPDLAAEVMTGKMRTTEALPQMRKDEILDKVAAGGFSISGWPATLKMRSGKVLVYQKQRLTTFVQKWQICQK